MRRSHVGEREPIRYHFLHQASLLHLCCQLKHVRLKFGNLDQTVFGKSKQKNTREGGIKGGCKLNFPAKNSKIGRFFASSLAVWISSPNCFGKIKIKHQRSRGKKGGCKLNFPFSKRGVLLTFAHLPPALLSELAISPICTQVGI